MWLCACVGTLLVGFACASSPRSTAPSYQFFSPSTPQTDPWYAKIEEWQERARKEADPSIRSEHMSRVSMLGAKMGAFAAQERLALANKIAVWARLEGRQYYRPDEDRSLAGDHWPTYKELAERNGDDCDGLDLIAYQLLIEFGFPRDELFRAVMRRNRDRRNHMVTLWFEDPQDPWVFDATGALTRSLVQFSETSGWTPTAVFNERDQFSVAESSLEADFQKRARAD
jgi:hypothetical protein